MSRTGNQWIENKTELVAPASFTTNPSTVEVAALFEDSIVDVKHLTPPRDAERRRRVLAWFAIGALLLATAGVAFGVAVSNAAANKAALHAWSESGRAMHDFRPHHISLAYDWLTFGGVIGGLFAIGFGLWRRSSRAQSRFDVDEFPLVAPSADGFVCNIAADMEGELVVGQRVTSFGDLIARGIAVPSHDVPGAHALALPHDGRVRVRRGYTTYVLATVPPPRQGVASAVARLESRVLGHFAASAVAHLGFLALIYNIPPSAKTLSADNLDGAGDRLITARITPNEEALPPTTTDSELATDTPAEGSEGGAETGESGKMGIQESTNADGRYQAKRRRDKVEMSRGEALASARDVGILRVFGAAGGAQDPFATVTGTTLAYTSGISDRDIYGGMTGNEYRDAHGGWGSGPRGMGPGGGGDKWGTIGTGNYDTIGDGGPGNGPLTMHGRPPGPRLVRDSKAPSKMTIGEVETGKYDKSIIRRYIGKKRGQLRHCYEKQLLVKRDLEGTVATVFVINGQGAVLTVTASGIGDAEVEGCVAATIKSINFPKPPDGGLHRVLYPFHFRPAGS